MVAPIQIAAGDQHGLNTLEHQPAKIAAIEGHWRNAPGESVPLILFGWPDMAARDDPLRGGGSPSRQLDPDAYLERPVRRAERFPRQDRPDSTVVFWTFRLMVGLGLLMLLLGLASAPWLRWRGRLYDQRLFLWFAVAMGPAGLVAILAGWVTTEMGRQPWVVYGVMRTKDAVSNHSALALTVTLAVSS